jgi:hypothetical protein
VNDYALTMAPTLTHAHAIETVADLIAALSTLPQDAPIYGEDGNLVGVAQAEPTWRSEPTFYVRGLTRAEYAERGWTTSL